jgi:hypothetical protein
MTSTLIRRLVVTVSNGSRYKTNICKRTVAMVTGESIIKPIKSEWNSKTDSSWISISGLSSFASRKDIDHILKDLDIDPLLVDPILSRSLFPTGEWAILQNNSDILQLQNKLKDKIENSVVLSAIKEDQFKQFRHLLASHNSISNRTVRLRNVPIDVQVPELKFFFQEYQLEESESAIVLMQSNDQNKQIKKKFVHYMVNFATPEEAERVVFEQYSIMFDGFPVQMHWYQS